MIPNGEIIYKTASKLIDEINLWETRDEKHDMAMTLGYVAGINDLARELVEIEDRVNGGKSND